MNLKAPCLLSLFLLPCVACETERATSDAGTTRAQQCTSVTFEYRNATAAPVRVLAYYELDGTRHSVPFPMALGPKETAEFRVPECVGPSMKGHLVTVLEGSPTTATDRFSGATRTRCVVTIEKAGYIWGSHGCAAE